MWSAFELMLSSICLYLLDKFIYLINDQCTHTHVHVPTDIHMHAPCTCTCNAMPGTADRPKEAESCYRRALSIKEDHINANTNMAHLCRLQGRWKEAVNHYSTALRRRPKNPLLHYYLGFVYEQMSSDEYRVVGRDLVVFSLCLSF